MRRGIATLLVLAGCGNHVVEAVHQGATPVFEACPVLPATSPWNQDISVAAVDPFSADYVASIGATAPLHATFGADPTTGVPWTVVLENQPKVAVAFELDLESDPGPYPIPADVAIEGGPGATGNRHALIVERGACMLFELFDLTQSSGSWHAVSGAIWPLRTDFRRPDYTTSADAAGLPIFPGLVRWDELSSGEIRHALRFSAPATQRAFVAPASHYASSLTDPALPPMGLRLRLKASVDISGYPPSARVILRALQRFGMFMTENGSPLAISGGPDPHWNDAELATLGQILGSDFEAIATGPLTR